MAVIAVSPDGQRIAFAPDLPGRAAPDIPEAAGRSHGDAAGRRREGHRSLLVPGQPADRLLGHRRRGLKKVDLSGRPGPDGLPQLRRAGRRSDLGTAQDVIVFSSHRAGSFACRPREASPSRSARSSEGETGRFWPQFLPDGRHYLYLSLASRPEDQGIYVGALDSDLRKRIVATRAHRGLFPSGLSPLREGRAPRGPALRRAAAGAFGRAAPVLERRWRGSPGTTAGRRRTSPSPRTACWPGVRRPPGDAQATDLVRPVGPKDGDGGRAGRLLRARPVTGREDAWRSAGTESSTNRDIWLLDVATRSEPEAHLRSPRRLRPGLVSRRNADRLLLRPPRRSGALPEAGGRIRRRRAAARLEGLSRLHTEDWSADGRFLAYNSARPGRDTTSSCCPCLAGSGEPDSLSRDPGHGDRRQLAPNGRWIAYMSNESGVLQVYVREVSPAGRARTGEMADLARARLQPAVASGRQGAFLLRGLHADGRRRQDGRPPLRSGSAEAAGDHAGGRCRSFPEHLRRES